MTKAIVRFTSVNRATRATRPCWIQAARDAQAARVRAERRLNKSLNDPGGEHAYNAGYLNSKRQEAR